MHPAKSGPPGRSQILRKDACFRPGTLIDARLVAALAQLVEHIIRNDGVTGSSPVSGTIDPIIQSLSYFYGVEYPQAERFWPNGFRHQFLPDRRIWPIVSCPFMPSLLNREGSQRASRLGLARKWFGHLRPLIATRPGERLSFSVVWLGLPKTLLSVRHPVPIHLLHAHRIAKLPISEFRIPR